MRYSPKLQTEGDPSVPPGTKEMKEFKFIQAKICTESCVSESPPFQPQPQLVPAFFIFLFFFSPPRILATLVVPFARARGLQLGLSLILRFFLLIHCNTKHDQCIIVSELVHPKNKQVLRSTFLGLRKTF